MASDVLRFKCLEALNKYIANHEDTHTVKYIVRSTDKSFTETLDKDKVAKKQKRFIDGIASTVIGCKVMHCRHGQDSHVSDKLKRRVKATEAKKSDHPSLKKSRRLAQDTWKFDCPATVKIQRLICYPEYKLPHEDTNKRNKCRILKRLSQDESPCEEEIFVLRISAIEAHQNHPTGKRAGMLQGIDQGLKDYIHEMVSQGVYSISEMKPHLETYRRKQFEGRPMPDKANRRFWPTDRDITNHMQAAFAATLGSGADQDNCQNAVIKWREAYPMDRFIFRPYIRDQQRLLFIQQTEQQRHLMSRYGDEMCQLDATYKTTKFSVYLFFICVKTNCDYQVVATFITMDETTAAIQEAISFIKEWNQSWRPKTWIVDYAQSEISALENLFPDDCKILLCSFHREQAWERNIKKTEYGIGLELRQVILSALRRIANSRTEEEYLSSKAMMESSDWWCDKQKMKFKSYVQNQWMAESMPKRWVECYRRDRFLFSVRTNNGIERMNRRLKQQYLRYKTNNSLARVLYLLVTQFIPQLSDSYRVKNDMCSGMRRKYSSEVPDYMRNRPKDMVQKCQTRRVDGEQLSQKVTKADGGTYWVQGESKVDPYKVTLDPSCTCLDYQRHLYPCKHIYGVLHAEGLTFMDLPLEYTSSPWFSLDYHVMSLTPADITSPSEESQPADVEPASPDSPPLAPDMAVGFGCETTELPKKAKVPSTTATECRELLRILASKTYLVADVDVLCSLSENLSNQLAIINKAIPANEEGLPYESNVKKAGRYAKRKQPTPKPNQSQQSKLPKRSLGSRWTGRVGVTAELCRPVNVSLTLTRARKILSRSKAVKRDSIKPPATEDIEVPYNYTDTKAVCDRIMDSKHELSGEDMDACLKLIHEQWPDINTQPTYLIGRPHKFDAVVQSNNEKYAQVLHMNSAHHWVSATNVGCNIYGRARLFDSLGLAIDHDIKCAISSLAACVSDTIKISRESVQRQEGATDCGLFAVANIVEAISGGNVGQARYDQTLMREHLSQCLLDNDMRPFPKVQTPTKFVRTQSKTCEIKLYCSCRRPYHKMDLERDPEGWKMVECSECKEWYHRRCLRLKATDIDPFTNQIADGYMCSQCISRGKGLV